MPKVEKFEKVYQRACKRKGGEAELKKLLKKPKSAKTLAKVDDSRFLAEFTKKVFQSGFVWRVVENKWPDFEKTFLDFDIQRLLMQPDEFYEKAARNPAIIRNFPKVKTVRENAYMIHDVRERQGSTFAAFVAEWPASDMVGLWDYLKKHGSRLGGNTGPYALRTLGKDTFLLSWDVEHYLKGEGVFDGASSSKRSRASIQAYFNEMHAQSGLSYTQISQIVSYSFGDNVVFPED